MWSPSNAFTSAFKRLDPVPQFKATAKLGEFLSQLPADPNRFPFAGSACEREHLELVVNFCFGPALGRNVEPQPIPRVEISHLSSGFAAERRAVVARLGEKRADPMGSRNAGSAYISTRR
jgi:hypothetical protein